MKDTIDLDTAAHITFWAFFGGVITGALICGWNHPATTPQVTEPTFDDLLDAIEWVESKGNSNAVGDGGDAIGAYQIHKVYVRDCNRICGRETYTYEDRYNKSVSRIMVSGWLQHYGGTFEEMARKHNGGPQGHKKESTKAYWEKVKDRLNRKG